MAHHQAPYTSEGGTVRWHRHLLKGADPRTFEVLSPHFARDVRAVWVCHRRFPDGDPASLHVLVEGGRRPTAWAADARHVYRTNLPRIERRLDASTLRMFDTSYAADGTKVWSFDTERTVRGADPARFTALGFGYGRDGKTAFYRGEPVELADLSSFRVIGADYAVDRSHVYSGRRQVSGVLSSGVRALGEGYLVGDDLTVFHLGSPLVGADAASFAVLGRWFAKDAGTVYLGGRAVPGADPSSFVETPGDHPAGRDGKAQYIWNAGAGLVRVVAARPTTVTLSEALASWWSALEAHAFPVLDVAFNTALPMALDATWARVDVKATPTLVRLDASGLVVERDGFRAAGSVAGFMHPLATAWAAARGRVVDGIPCVRLLDERSWCAGPRGDLVRRRLLEVCFSETMALVDSVAERPDLSRDELAMLLDLADRRASYVPALAAETVIRRIRHALPEPLPLACIVLNATTNLAAIKGLLDHPFVRSKDPRERLAAAEFLHARLSDLEARKGRHLVPLLAPWNHCLDDTSARVREVAWENLDLAVQVLFEMDNPPRELCLEPLRRLVAAGVNLDVNLARLWECESAAGRRHEAEAVWARLQSLVGDIAQAPAPQYCGSAGTPTFLAWREVSERRLASSPGGPARAR